MGRGLAFLKSAERGKWAREKNFFLSAGQSKKAGGSSPPALFK